MNEHSGRWLAGVAGRPCQPCRTFLLLLALLLLVRATAGVTSEPQHARSQVTSLQTHRVVSSSTVPSCFDNTEFHREVKPQRLYVDEKEQPLTMLTSSRVPQQLMTRMVAIFLKELLGYVNLTITTVPDTFDPGRVINEMKPDKQDSSSSGPLPYVNWGASPFIYEFSVVNGTLVVFAKSSMEVRIPKAMVSLEVWIPPGYNVESLTTDFETSSYLGSGGRFGWFMPKRLLRPDFIVEHWRSFTSPNSPTLKLFSRTQDELNTLSFKMRDPTTGEFYCPESLGCEDGLYVPSRCSAHQPCAVLFASYADYNVTKFLRGQIEAMKAYVIVSWIGPNLNHKFIKNNSDLSGLEGEEERSILIFHWWPSVLLQPFDFISVSFPPCIDRTIKADGDSPYQCKYEMHRFHKFLWKKLKRYAKFAYNAFHKVQVNHTDFMDLLDTYNMWKNKSSLALDEVACHWMKNNKQRWLTWQPGSTLHQLKMVGLFPISTEKKNRRKFIAPGNVPAYFMAVEAVNKNKSILTDFEIHPIVLNGACEPAMVMRQFIEILQMSSSQGFYNNMIGFVGPACSDTVEPIAGVSKYFNVPIISYGAEGAIFSDQDHYPYFFRTIPENKIFRYVYSSYFKREGWKRVASLTENGQRYSEYLTLLRDKLQEDGIELETLKYPQERKTPDMTQYLLDLKNKNYYIIIGDFYQDVAREVICDAYHLKMTGHQAYLWFLPHWFSADWYDVDKVPSYTKCTTAQMHSALQGHMSLSYKYFAEDNDIMQEGITVAEWRKLYSQRINTTVKTKNASESDYAGFTYDAVWTYALALDNLFKKDPSYAADLRATSTIGAFMKEISAISFNGVSGHINFSSGASRMTDIIVWQFQNKEYVEVGRFHPPPSVSDTGEDKEIDFNFKINKDRFLWPTGEKPVDGSTCAIQAFSEFVNLECAYALIVLCTLCFGGLILLLFICFCIFKRRYEKKLEQIQELWRRRPLFEIFDGWEIPRDKVVINRKLGEGAFGTVYGGECQFDTEGWVAVAVKTLKVGSTISEKLDFLSEAEMMKNFEHENIVRLLGVCTKTEPIYTVMEFMLYGDLKVYLLARRNLVNEKNRNDDDEVSNKRLTSMALDIARGLAYLADLKFVHRDVACRNCLVNANRTVKLADFGMTRPMYENNYYKFNRKGMLPVRWMAPESLTEGVFTTMSDIWSYGVLLYEIVTFGAFPFQGMSNDQVLEHVKAGHTIAIPRGIKPQLDVLLKTCWHRVPSRRPQVLQIIEHLIAYPRLISPSLDGPQSSVQIEDTVSLEMRIPDKTRKLSLSINNRLQNVASSSRKRSMSGNMVMNIPPLTTSLSEDGMISAHSNLDALNLNHVMVEENEMGEDPLLPPAQYVSSRYMSLTPKEHKEKEKESLVSRQQGDYCTTDISRDLWTNVTPV
ncbi:receptor-type guanylate cyclase gcy-1-like isoform X2 [Homarus americanus]|uniref:receptor-type guanylate cyclase gcy-1-like isoform X2 n=1 Tax=Homarus americanus TaxID=6706 RepID=UPI001C473A43|nr:receptor-type guanylate cyclase gcy-1-like isoform X2 [Homarus americanus]